MSFRTDDVYQMHLDTGLVLSYKIVGVYHGAVSGACAEIGTIGFEQMGFGVPAAQEVPNGEFLMPMRVFEKLITSGVFKQVIVGRFLDDGPYTIQERDDEG